MASNDIRTRRDGSGRQYAAMPLVQEQGATRVVLVTSRDTGRWVLPKGWAERRLSGAELAAKEAFEEAGLVGAVQAQSLGTYGYLKRLPRNAAMACRVEVFSMRVDTMLEDWPEREQRQRRSFTLAEAAETVAEAELQDLLRALAAAE